MYSCSGVFGILVRWYLVGLVESVDTRVAENAKKLWLEEIPASHKHGTNQHSEGEDNGNHCPNMNAPGLLARLKRDHPALS